MNNPTTRKIEVFRPGTFVAMGGETCSFTADDLRAMAAAFDPETGPVPGVIGHPKTDDPSYCWATSFSFDEGGQRLVAEVGDIEPQFADMVAAKRYSRISLSLFPPTASNNPKPGKWYPKHIGFLGAAAPAVSGLKNVAFAAADDALTFEFADARALRDVASVFTSLREWMIEKFGLDAADKALPRWPIEWIDAAADRDPSPEPAFAEPVTKDIPMTDPKTNGGPTAEELAARAADLDKRERALVHADNVSFAEQLVTGGQLVPALKDKVVGLLNAVTTSAGEVSFAEGGTAKTVAAGQLLRDVLAALPKAVSFGQVDTGNAPTGAVQFAAPEGSTVDPDRLALHDKALAYQAQHPGTDYLAAVTAAQRA